MNLPKTLIGIGLVLLGAAASAVPIIQSASPILMKTGAGVIVIGVTAKAVRKKKGGDPFAHEKALLKRKEVSDGSEKKSGT